jgi:hypothetical protein
MQRCRRILGVSTPAWCPAPGLRRFPDSSSLVILRCARKHPLARAGFTRSSSTVPHAGAPAKRKARHLHTAGLRLDAALPDDRRCAHGPRRRRRHLDRAAVVIGVEITDDSMLERVIVLDFDASADLVIDEVRKRRASPMRRASLTPARNRRRSRAWASRL